MKRGTIFIVLFLVIAAAIVGASTFLRAQPPVGVRIAVHPLAADWVRAAAGRFNAGEPVVNGTTRIVVNIEPIDDLAVWNANAPWTASNHPDGWIPALAASVDYAAASRISFTTVVPSVGQSMLLWGGFTGEVNAITENGTRTFDWSALQTNIGTVNPALPHPTRTVQGLAVLLSAAAHYAETEFLDAALLGDDFRQWVRPILEAVPNYNTLGSSPAQTLAARGPSAGGVALLPETEWITSLTGFNASQTDPIRLNYPLYNVLFDFPLARWNGLNDAGSPQDLNSAAIAAGVDAFGAFLMSDAERANAEAEGLRTGIIQPPTADVFVNAQRYGAVNMPDLSHPVQLPERNDLRAFIEWARSVVGS
ncbi:MAG: substrate-binding domain-containing protein [bacterium]|nr:substrate-binding domain-containing protein [bacterium]